MTASLSLHHLENIASIRTNKPANMCILNVNYVSSQDVIILNWLIVPTGSPPACGVLAACPLFCSQRDCMSHNSPKDTFKTLPLSAGFLHSHNRRGECSPRLSLLTLTLMEGGCTDSTFISCQKEAAVAASAYNVRV